MSEGKFAALGNRKELLPLKSLGFNILDCKDFREVQPLIEKLSSEGYDLVIIAENIVEGNQSSFFKIIRDFPLNILVLPEYKIRKNFAKEIVKKVIREAVGL